MNSNLTQETSPFTLARSLHPSRRQPRCHLEMFRPPFLHAITAAATVCFLHIFCHQQNRTSISYPPGPDKSDPFFGNLTDICFEEAGKPPFDGGGSTSRCSKFMASSEYITFNCNLKYAGSLGFSGVPDTFRSQGDAVRLRKLALFRTPETK